MHTLAKKHITLWVGAITGGARVHPAERLALLNRYAQSYACLTPVARAAGTVALQMRAVQPVVPIKHHSAEPLRGAEQALATPGAMLSCTETTLTIRTLVAEIAAAEGQTMALSALLHSAQAAWAERDALRDRQEMVLRREAERDEEEIERLRGHSLLDRTERRGEHAMQSLQEVRLSLEGRAQEGAPGGGGSGRTSSAEWAAALKAIEREKDLERSAALHAQAAAHEAERAEAAQSAVADRSARHTSFTDERGAAVARAREEERAAARLQSARRAEVARAHARRAALVQAVQLAAAEAAQQSAAEGEAAARQAAEDSMRRMAYEAAAREAAVAHALRESEAEARSLAAAAEAIRRESSLRVQDGRKAERAAEAEERRARASGVEVANALRKKLGEVRHR